MLTLHAKKKEKPQPTTITKTVTGTITLPFYDGSTDFAILYSDEIAGKTSAMVTLGSALGCSARRLVNDAQFNEISTTENKATGPTNANGLTIRLQTAASNYKFKPTNIAFNACKVGTDGGKFDLSLDGTSLYTGIAPNRNNETGGYYSSYSKDLSSSLATEHNFIFNIYALQNKPLGLGHIVITGQLTYTITLTKGDVNGDGSVDFADVVALANYIITNNGTSIILEAADTSEDDTISLADVTALVNMIKNQ